MQKAIRSPEEVRGMTTALRHGMPAPLLEAMR
jgi:hypothetical protein